MQKLLCRNHLREVTLLSQGKIGGKWLYTKLVCAKIMTSKEVQGVYFSLHVSDPMLIHTH
jgi:hypothetical protein